ncbi:MFS transporter [Amycolatopsis endophytica]|uniref:MFS family permease n=1 Tax=Amycolatopsis endophytica TaxID=860233 RepID=A0A853BE32_9PSEU|nr:MFS transporter [Amycolatopsis endophytica]NYI93280.1 MFS family permease [Amycolatopsis endophytica]
MSSAPARHAGTPATGAVKPGGVVAVLAFTGIVVSLMQTLIIPLVPELPRLLDASSADAAWAITATLLAGAVATPTVGRLGDMYGKRRMLLFSAVLLVAGSVTCGLSGSLVPMIIGRTLQGLSAAVIPLGISIMRDELPPERLGSATALMSASLGVGGALGLPAAALIAENADWHALFWTAAGLGAVALVLVALIVPESRVRAGGRFDVPGAVGLSVALVCLLLAISKGADWGWGDPLTLGLFAAAVVVLLLWGWWELRAKQPLVDLRTTARRQVLLTNIASVVFGFAMFATSLVFPQLLQLPAATGYGLGQSMLVAGLVMAPSGLIMMATAPVSARVTRTRGPKITLMLGAIVVAVGYGLSILLMGEVWQLVIGALVIGAGIGLAYGALPALIMGAVPVSETAAANSLNMLMRSIGTSTSSAVAGVVLAQMTVTLGPVSLPSQDGFRVVLAVAGCAALAALVVAAFLPAQRKRAAQAPVTGRTVGGTVRGASSDPALVTVTAHRADGSVAASTAAGADGRYTLADLPAEPLTVVAVEHPAVRETVVLDAGRTRRHDIDLTARKELA